MTNMNIGASVASEIDTSNAYTVPMKVIDGIQDTDETVWQNQDFTKQWSLFNAVPDLKSALIMKAIWNVGKGYTCDADTKGILEHITGNGKDTFDDILFNLDVMKRVGGDSYAEIIRDPDTKLLVNLKPLDPGTVRVIFNKKGRIIRYEQINKGNKPQTFEPEDILHLSNNRLADQIHGLSDIDALEKTILADEQSFYDTATLMHFQSRPMLLFKIGTDDATQIADFKTKMDAARESGKNMYVPFDTNTVDVQPIEINVQEAIFTWRTDLRNRFYRAVGLPQVVPGAGGQSTESESKVIYLAFEQIVEREQRQLEQQLWQQLTIRINLYPPATISQELQQDQAKDGAAAQLTPQPAELDAGSTR